MLSGQDVKKSKDEVRQQAEEEIRRRAEKITRREPPKGLLLKQRKLLSAAKANNLETVIASGYTYFETDVNVRDDRKNTPLYYAAKFGNLEFCRYLTDIGARVNEPCERGNTPLHMAFKSDNDGVNLIFYCFFIESQL
jgi:ankyrin repeat protein